MRRVSALALLLALAAGCGSVSDREEEPGLTLRAVPASDRPLRESDLDDAVRILENRLERAHIDATLTRREDWRVAVELDADRTADVDRAVELATSRGVLEFYDLEAASASSAPAATPITSCSSAESARSSARPPRLSTGATSSWRLRHRHRRTDRDDAVHAGRRRDLR